MKLVTIYITNYNYGAYLKSAIDSALRQTYANIEVLIFDDGSTDQSIEVLSAYQADPRIRIIQKRNEGLNSTIIQAFGMANGDYVIRLDADDWFDPMIIDRLVDEIEKDPDVALVFPDYYEVDEHGRMLHQVKRHDFARGVTLLDQPAHGACTLVRKSHYLAVGGHNSAHTCQDGVDLWLALTRRYKVANVNEPLFYYRKHAASISSNQIRMLQTRFNIYADHAHQRGFVSRETLAVIPVRGRKVNGRELALLEIAGRPLIDWSIEKAARSKEVRRIAVLSESEDVIEYVTNVSEKFGKPLVAYRRDARLAAVGTDLALTVLDYLALPGNQNVTIVVVLTIDTPFSLVNYIDTAIYSMFLYNTDSVDSVMLDNAIFYYHDGQGLKLWQDIRVRAERDNVYVRKGGISVIKREQLERQQSMITEIMGHVIVDKISAFALETQEDLLIAGFVGKEIVGVTNGIA
jgi:glycosyltransferase involved in cell wall biosynthesis